MAALFLSDASGKVERSGRKRSFQGRPQKAKPYRYLLFLIGGTK